MYAVVIPTLCRYDLLVRCLACVARQTVQPERIVVVDNGGTFETDIPGVEIVRPGRNFGVAGGWNLGMDTVAPLDAWILNDDFFPAPDVSAKMLSTDGPVVLAPSYSSFFIRRSTFEKVGRFDEAFWPAYYEDTDYDNRLKILGIPPVAVPVEGCDHAGSATVAVHRPPEFDRGIDANGVYYRAKWGIGAQGDGAYPLPFDGAPAAMLSALLTRFGSDKDTVHSYAGEYAKLFVPRGIKHQHRLSTYAERLPVLCHEVKRVLEIGVGSGGSLRAWAEVFPNAEIVGADRDTPHHPGQHGPRVKIQFANQATGDGLRDLAAAGPWDLIIDDASHVSADQWSTFAILKDSLVPGGRYVVEDIASEPDVRRWATLPGCRIVDNRSVKGRFDDVFGVYTAPGCPIFGKNAFTRRDPDGSLWTFADSQEAVSR